MEDHCNRCLPITPQKGFGGQANYGNPDKKVSWDSFIGLPVFTGLARTFTCVTAPMNLLDGVGMGHFPHSLSTESLFHGFSLRSLLVGTHSEKCWQGRWMASDTRALAG